MIERYRLTRRGFAAMAGGAALTATSAGVFAQTGTATPPASAGGDVFDTLIRDHRRAEQLFGEIERADPQQRLPLLRRLQAELTAHAVAEENVVYPAMIRLVKNVDNAKELYEEHQEMKVALFDLEMITMDNQRWLDRLRDLRRSVLQHAQDEETKEFPALRQALDARQMQLLTQRVQMEKQKFS